MFRVVVDEIPDAGVEIKGRMQESWVTPLLRPQYLWAGIPLSVFFSVSKAEKNLVVRGRLDGRVLFQCSRCAGERPLDVCMSFTHLFLAGACHEAAFEEEEITADEKPEVTVFDGDSVDLEPLAAEEFVLSLPDYPLCSEGCRGLCQRCGKDLNDGPCDCVEKSGNPVWDRLVIPRGADAGPRD